MSLAAAVLRNLTVLALMGKTLAGDEVRSSLLLPVNEVAPNSERPILAVFTDVAKTDAEKIRGRDIIGAETVVTLALEIAVFTRPPATDADDQTIVIPETDEGLELTIDVIERQAIAELQAGSSAFADLWRQFVFKVVGTNAERGVAAERGLRFAARRVEILVELIGDPIPGQTPLPLEWEAALHALEDNTRTTSMAVLIRSVAEGTPVPPWQALRGELGITDAAARMVSIGPFSQSDADDGGIRPATQLEVDDSDRGLEIKVTASGATVQQGDDGTPSPLSEPPQQG